jgi:hypothetical protein
LEKFSGLGERFPHTIRQERRIDELNEEEHGNSYSVTGRGEIESSFS